MSENKRKTIFISAVAGLILIGFILNGLNKKNKLNSADFVLAQKGTIIQEVSVTGHVQPAQSVDLSFEKSGKISWINAEIGKNVLADQVLIALSNSDMRAQVTQAQAQVQSSQAQYAEMQKGTRTEELAVYQTKLDNAKNNLLNVQEKAAADLSNLYDDVKDILNDAYTKADDAVGKQTDDLFTDDASASPKLSFITSNSQAETDLKWSRISTGQALINFKNDLENLSHEQEILDQELIKAENYLSTIKTFLEKTSQAINLAVDISSNTMATYKANINLGRANINTALTNINTQKQALSAQKITNQNNISIAQNTLNSAQEDLNLKLAGYSAEQLSVQKSTVEQAQANLQNYQAQLSKTYIIAPFAGIITKQDGKIGQTISPNVPVISMMSKDKFEIETNIPEVDIAKVKINNTAKITLDAYGNNLEFTATVISIEPAETMIDGVATYKTKLQFTQPDEKIKSGMTANVDILTAQKENALYLPQRVLGQKDGKYFVTIEKDNLPIEQKIEIGLKGSDGNVEIVSGLSEGDRVLLNTK